MSLIFSSGEFQNKRTTVTETTVHTISTLPWQSHFRRSKSILLWLIKKKLSCKSKFHFSHRNMIDAPTKHTSLFQGRVVESLPPSKTCTFTAMLWSAAVRVFSFSRRKRPTLIGPFDTSKRKISAAFDRCDWQSVLVISKNPPSECSCLSCAPAAPLKWLHVMTALSILRWIYRLRFSYVHHRPVLLRSEQAWYLLHRPVCHCRFLFLGFWIVKMIPFNVRQIHCWVSKVVSCFLHR